MFTEEVEEVRRLLAPGTRRQAEAEARLRSLAIMDGSIRGEFTQPGESDLKRLGQQIRDGRTLDDIFPGITSVDFSSEGAGAQISLRIMKKDGIPVSLVPEGTPNSGVVAVRRVDELGFYNLGHRELSAKVGLTTNKTTAAICILDLKSDSDCYKSFKIGASAHQRYSQNAVTRIRDLLAGKSAEEIWETYRASK